MYKFFPFILALVSTSLFSQAYKPLLDNVNEWQFTTCNFGCLTDKYFTDGDTIVDGNTFKILDGFHYISRTFLLREQVPERKVFMTFASSSGNTEYLLYDFSMEVGDSIDMKNPISPFITDAGYYEVDSIIPRPLVDGNDYRHFYLSPTLSNTISTDNAVWVEGVGSMSLINAPGGFPDINEVGNLSCFFKDGELFYSNLDSISGCVSILDLTEIGAPLRDLIVSTSLSEGIGLMSNASEVKYVDIFDLSGRRVQSISNSASPTLVLDFSNLQAGVYLLVAYNNRFQKRSFKVVVD
ncbi:T9SS type A sorting domain-containing protein [Ulvibacter antarcticus]|uniref:Putative secreted protein (Por secretion system target) n=1 Tax=Ulvibacter antarcticus TaxID=442714 RepID=A0A3L9YU87_9FLAO|nr:T9SS type A sorting domain-containing protein [Ulvibacter antarcticus]RMA64216.1 putative secreted protein (Por secretion system target) [Ulvibacter antarcticus]